MASSNPNDSLLAINNEDDELHIAMFPWLAFGHIIPYLELAKLFAQKGHRISFISAPRNIDRLPKIPRNLSKLITFVKIPLPDLPGLPNGAESTKDLPPEKVPILKKAYDLLQNPMAEFLEASKPDWLLHDFAAFWLPETSRIAGVRCAFFSTYTASALVYVGAEIPDYRESFEDFVVKPRWVPFSSSVAFRRFEVLRVLAELTGTEDDIALPFRIAKCLRGCDVVLVRSCPEIENEYIQLLGDILRKPVVPIGPLPPLPPNDLVDESDTWRSTKDWLDSQRKKSVVYVAFGTEIQRSDEELVEIALGLELSKLPFFWVLRGQTGSSGQLPNGFEERVKGRGVICRSWAPQVRILSHDSIGVFLTHSGWSSVIEALRFAVPMVVLAGANDQGLNAKLLEEKTIGYLVPRDEVDGSFTGDSVAESLKLVLEKQEGEIYRDKAIELSGLFGDQRLQEKYMDDFLGLLKTHGIPKV